MYDSDEGPRRVSITEAQIAVLARIRESYHVRSVTLTEIGGATRGHKELIAVETTLWSGEGGRGASSSAEWIIAGDGEVLSREAAAAEPEDKLREGMEPV
jgi:hypothetical protein